MISAGAPIVSPEWLEQRLGDSLVILEISQAQLEASTFRADHIPNSLHVYWKDLCWHDSDRQFPDPREMAVRLARLGVGPTTPMVLVGDPIQYATYAFWVLTLTGHADNAVILDGGRLRWAAQGRPLTSEVTAPAACSTQSWGTPNPTCRTGRDDVLAGLTMTGRTLLDMRSDEEYFGERVSPATMDFDHGAERVGRIPGAVHLHYERFLTPQGEFRSAEDINAELSDAGVPAEDEVVTYCRLSHRATLGWFALTRIVGRDSVRVYDGSWTEWGSMVGMPVETERAQQSKT